MTVMKRKEDHLLLSVSNHCHVKYLMGPINLLELTGYVMHQQV